MKIQNKVTLDNGQEIVIGDKVILTNDQILFVESFNFQVFVRHFHEEGEFEVSGVNVQGVKANSGDFTSVEKHRIKSKWD